MLMLFGQVARLQLEKRLVRHQGERVCEFLTAFAKLLTSAGCKVQVSPQTLTCTPSRRFLSGSQLSDNDTNAQDAVSPPGVLPQSKPDGDGRLSLRWPVMGWVAS